MTISYYTVVPNEGSSDETIDLTVVIPVYNGAETISEVVAGVRKAAEGKGTLQIVLIDDGSQDASHGVCSDLAEKHPRTITYLRLAKNFGEHNAVMAGLRHARGRYSVIMDDDMQNLPEDAVRLYQEARDKDFDVVYSVYGTKRHSWFRNFGSAFNGCVANLLLDKPEDLYLSSFKALSSKLVREIVKYTGPNPYIDGLALRCTRNIGRVEVSHHERSRGESGYTLRKLMSLWFNMFVNFSIMPLRMSTAVGMLSVLTASIMILNVLYEKLVYQDTPPGYAYITITIMAFAGAQLIMLGLIGEYLGRMFLTQNQTPQYVIRDQAGLEVGPGPGA